MAHPLSKFAFCPACGSGRFTDHDAKSRRCADCSFVYYLNPSSACVAVIIDGQGRLLVERRGREPSKGTLDLPGGFADFCETVEEGLCREVLEETGLKVVSSEYLFSLPNEYFFSDFTIPTLDMFFRCEVADASALRAGDDAAECFWLPLSEVKPELFGLSSIRRGVERLLTER